MDIVAWLRGLSLEQYEPAFRDNEIDWEVLPKLTSEDLKEIGVVAIGHRRKLLEAIAALGAEMPSAAVASAPHDASTQPDAERRQLTVMFCDLVGSTPLSARYDPEDLREIVGAYHRCVADTVARYAGFVAKYMGDGVLIYFGYPEAHEDDAERAVRAGLAVIDAVGGLTTAEPLNVRLGIASGLVVVGDLIGAGSAQERGVVGETPNLAARLQALARPGTLVVADATRRQIGTLFEIEELGPQPLAGFAEPQHAWRVTCESGVLSRFEALRSGTTPLVGRDEELDLLLRRWQQAKLGEGRVVLVSGEPGIGKSRLTAALAQAIQDEPHTRLRYFCSPHHQDSALYPFITQLERAAGFARTDTAEEKLGKLRELLAPSARGGDEIEFLSELLSLPSSASDLNLSPQRKREMLFEALLQQLIALAQNQLPTLMVFEDAHWIDPTSREFLDLTIDRVSRLPVLVVITFRPEFQQAWSGPPHVVVLALNRLGGRDGTTLVERLAGNAGLAHETVQEIVERADGVPLFVEELTKAVLESGDGDKRIAATLAASPSAALTIPATLHASLIARLDRLGPSVKEVGQIGAVIGREFGYDLIAQVADRPSTELRLGLDRLAQAGLLFCRGVAPQSSYVFKHALVQDAAYGTLLRSKREALHSTIARVLEERFPELVQTQPEILAHHFRNAGFWRRAAEYSLAAGRRAATRSANPEAISHYRNGLTALTFVVDGQERDLLELDIQVALRPAMVASFGYASAEVIMSSERARVLSEGLPSSPHLFTILRGLCNTAAASARTAEATELGERLLAIADAEGDPIRQSVARRIVGSHAIMFIKLAKGLTLVREGIALWDRHGTDKDALIYGDDPSAIGRGYAACALWLLGYPDQATQVMGEAVDAAECSSYRSMLPFVLNLACTLDILCSAFASAYDRAEQTFALCRDDPLPPRIAYATVCSGRALVGMGEAERGYLKVRMGLEEWHRINSRVWTGAFGTWATEACLKSGRIDEAVTIATETKEYIEACSERAFHPEWCRVWSSVQLGRGDGTTAAEETLVRALQLARENQAKSWELRSATSLARLWGEQGRRSEARYLLAPVYGWFTEGFDTADLKDAKVLLDELA